MNNLPLQHVLVRAALDHLPPILKNALLDDEAFLKRWEISTVTGMTLGKSGPSFTRDQLYRGIRAAIREPNSQVPIVDEEEVSWNIVARTTAPGFSFFIEGSGKQFAIPDHSALAEDLCIRIAWLERATRDISLEGAMFQEWKRRMGRGPLGDDEFAELVSDFALTPTSVCQDIRHTLGQGSVSVATLVPVDRRYYERLTGSLTSGTYVTDFVEGELALLMERLRERDPTQGFSLSLLTCSDGTVSANIRIDHLNTEQLVSGYEWLVEKGDPISQIGGVEVALAHLDMYPELETPLATMVEKFIADDPDDDGGWFSLLSAIVVLVSAELTRTNTLRKAPPFYRRQVAIAQASLIIRAIIDARVDRESITNWANTVGGGHISFLQGLVDLRVEPRWLPDFFTPHQIRADFIGRVVHAVLQNEAKIQSQSLRTLVADRDSRLFMSVEGPLSMLPGPLQGTVRPREPIPEDYLADVTARLEAEQLEPNSFAGLVNAALIFDLPAGLAELAATALRRVKYSIDNAGDEKTIFGLIRGLAIVASVTRDTVLADTLRVLVRVFRRKRRLQTNPDEELRIVMMAAASHEELGDWAGFAGEWITEFAFEIEDKEAAQRCLWMLRRLVQIEPALAVHCTAADAALASFAP